MTAVEFDFETKQERTIEAAEVPAACAAGRFCWIDIDQMADPAGAAGTSPASIVRSCLVSKSNSTTVIGRGS